MENLERLLQANIAKMNILEAELEHTQKVLVNMFSSSQSNKTKSIKIIEKNFKDMRELFDNVIRELYQKD